MIKASLVIGLAVVGLTLVLAAVPAGAEFTSLTTEAKGKGESIDVTLEGGGGTITCQGFEEASSLLKWTVTKGGELVTHGPAVGLDFEKWGNCLGKSSEIKETTAKVSECELGLLESGEERTVLASVSKACTIKMSTSCEVKIEPSENKKLENVLLDNSGKEDENLIFGPRVTNLATLVNGSCPGIKASKEAKLTGEIEAKQLQPASLSEFTALTSRPFVFASPLPDAATLTLRRRSGLTAAPLLIESIDPEIFSVEEPARSECNKSYAIGQGCSYSILYKGTEPELYRIEVSGVNNVRAGVIVRGR